MIDLMSFDLCMMYSLLLIVQKSAITIYFTLTVDEDVLSAEEKNVFFQAKLLSSFPFIVEDHPAHSRSSVRGYIINLSLGWKLKSFRHTHTIFSTQEHMCTYKQLSQMQKYYT